MNFSKIRSLARICKRTACIHIRKQNFLSGERILAVSAINLTPAKRIISALFEAALRKSKAISNKNQK